MYDQTKFEKIWNAMTEPEQNRMIEDFIGRRRKQTFGLLHDIWQQDHEGIRKNFAELVYKEAREGAAERSGCMIDMIHEAEIGSCLRITLENQFVYAKILAHYLSLSGSCIFYAGFAMNCLLDKDWKHNFFLTLCAEITRYTDAEPLKKGVRAPERAEKGARGTNAYISAIPDLIFSSLFHDDSRHFYIEKKEEFQKEFGSFGLNYLRRLYAFGNIERDRLNYFEGGMSKKAEEMYRKTTEVIVAFREAISSIDSCEYVKQYGKRREDTPFCMRGALDKALDFTKYLEKIFKEVPEAQAVESDMLRMINFRAMIKAM
jgi:hypothetical protein